MRKHRTKIIAAFVVLAVLAGAWFLGGTPDINEPILMAESTEPETPETTIEPSLPPIYESEISELDIEITIYEPDPTPEPEEQTTEQYYPEEQQTEPTLTPLPTPSPTPTPAPAPSPTPVPTLEVEPENAITGDGSFTVTLEIRVDMLLANMDMLHPDKHELVPANGIIFPRTEVTAYEGESVFNVLQREMRRHRIHMASRFTPILNSAYVEAINNIYEFDAGSLSGWVYRVNGSFPNFGSSRYMLSPGDAIEWHFSLDLGRDLGMDWGEGGQLDD